MRFLHKMTTSWHFGYPVAAEGDAGAHRSALPDLARRGGGMHAAETALIFHMEPGT